MWKFCLSVILSLAGSAASFAGDPIGEFARSLASSAVSCPAAPEVNNYENSGLAIGGTREGVHESLEFSEETLTNTARKYKFNWNVQDFNKSSETDQFSVRISDLKSASASKDSPSEVTLSCKRGECVFKGVGCFTNTRSSECSKRERFSALSFKLCDRQSASDLVFALNLVIERAAAAPR